MVFTSCLTVLAKLPQSGLEIVPSPKVVSKLSQSCPKVDWTDRLAADGRLVSTTCLPVDTQVQRLDSGHMQTHSDTIGKWTNIIIKLEIQIQNSLIQKPTHTQMNKKKGEAPSATTHFVLSYVRVQSQNIESGLK